MKTLTALGVTGMGLVLAMLITKEHPESVVRRALGPEPEPTIFATASGPIVKVPTWATGFKLVVKYPGGYESSADGKVAFVTGTVTPTETPACVEVAYGRGLMGRCYDCAGNEVEGTYRSAGAPCGPPGSPTPSGPTRTPMPPTNTPTPGGLICGPIPGIGLCYYCATGDPAPCPGVSPPFSPTLSPTPGLPTSTPIPPPSSTPTPPQASLTPTPTRGRPPAGMSIGSIFLTMRYTAGGVSHEATAVNLTGEAGYFWFFSQNNIEVTVKVLDARAINGHYWIFWAAMTDLEWTLTVRSSTGTIRTYSAPVGRQTSGLDTESF